MSPPRPPLESWRLFFPLAAGLAVAGLGAWAAQLSGRPLGLLPADHGAFLVWGAMGAGVQGFLLTAYARQNDHPLPTRPHLFLQLALQAAAAAALLGPTPLPGPARALVATAPWWLLLAWTVRVAVPSLRRRWDATTAAVPVVLASGLVGLGLHLAGSPAPRGVDVGVGAFLVPLALAVLDRVLPFFSSRVTPGYTGARRPGFLGPVLLLAWVGLLAPAWAGLAAVAQLLLLARQVHGWRPWPAARTPSIAVLHLGVAWFAVGWALVALGAPRALALHAFTVGGLGTLLLAVSMRVVSGHAGLPIALGRVGGAAIVLAQIAALGRLWAGLSGSASLLLGSAAALGLAFAGWLYRFGPVCGPAPLRPLPRRAGDPVQDPPRTFMPLPTAARDAVGALAECHVRIRAYLDGLARIVALPDLADPRVPTAAAQARRYLVEGLPLHAADEDASLAPRLRRAQPDHGPLLDRLARDHAAADLGVERLLPFLDTLVEGGAVDRPAFAAAVGALATLMEAHLRLEEAELFPALRGLEPAKLLAAGAEMVDRRRS